MKKIITILLSCTLFLWHPKTASAQETQNNKFGIHIIDEHDLEDAASLVNSNGGQWGYVTFVIREDQRDFGQWQKAFDQMRRLKLIPIVRLASKMEKDYWTVPTKEEATNWAGFLNSLNWPVKERYVILFNEPNHAREWGGKVDPANFAQVYKTYYETLKSFSSDFFVMPAAVDLAADGGNGTLEAAQFFEKMYEEDTFIFTLFDGLNSHSYPNPGFEGSATDTGKKSIQGYKWELSHLYNFGLAQDTPVFITETGWIKNAGNLEENYKYAFENVWSDPQVKAVTPFLLNYLDEPFDDFSWRDPETREFYPQYYSVQSMTKLKGTPQQLHLLEFEEHNIADFLTSDSEYSFKVKLKNIGQSIWSNEDGFYISYSGTLNKKNIIIEKIKATEPSQTAEFNVRIKTDEPRGIHSIKLVLFKDDEKISDILSHSFTLVSPPSINLFANFWFGQSKNNTASLRIYDDEKLVSSFDNLSFKNGSAKIESVKNVIPNKEYKFVLTKPFFLSVTRDSKLYVGTVDINFGRLLPLDLNGDGNFDVKDFLTHILNPLSTKMKLLGIHE